MLSSARDGGQNNDWGQIYSDNPNSKAGSSLYSTDTPKTNIAIKGLFHHIEPGSAEATALEANGYKKVDWGKAIVDNADEFDKYLFYDYDYVSAPIYLWPFTPNVLANGGFTNGYGFKQE